MEINWKNRITIYPEIRFGKLRINKTRIVVEDMLGWLASKVCMEEITEDFPEITRVDIIAALGFTAYRQTKTTIMIAA